MAVCLVLDDGAERAIIRYNADSNNKEDIMPHKAKPKRAARQDTTKKKAAKKKETSTAGGRGKTRPPKKKKGMKKLA